jgi:hypothetical protein
VIPIVNVTRYLKRCQQHSNPYDNFKLKVCIYVPLSTTTTDDDNVSDSNMARAHRVAAISAFCLVLYLLAFFRVVSVPFMEERIADEILPVVSSAYKYFHLCFH